MTSLSKWPTTLSDKDRAFLQENLDLELGPFEEDPQAQALYAVESNEIAMRSPVWTRGQVESWVGARATSLELRVKVAFRKRNGAYAYVGHQGGTILLPVDRAGCSYRPVGDGEYLAYIVVHEFAHVVTVNEHWGKTIQSHGPQFVGCFLDLLASVMRIHRTEQALAFLGVLAAPGVGRRTSPRRRPWA